MSVRVSGITKMYGQQKALDNVSFEIKRGEVVGFLGPNGAGKSTMMKIVTGYVKADSGNVSVCGVDVTGGSTEARKLIGYLPEHNPLYLDMYVREYLKMVAGMYKMDKIEERVEEIIEKTGLTPESHKQIGSLSKGYRQRVGIAQALISDPEVIILDEPTTGLDPNQIVEIRELIKNVGQEKTVMLSTHIMQEVEAVCDRVIIIDHGRLRADGNINEIAIKANGGMTVEVEFDKQVDEEDLRRDTNTEMVEHLGHNSYRLTCHSERDFRADIFHYAVRNGLVLLQMSTANNSMETLFHELTESDY